jgi:hypothetical protein
MHPTPVRNFSELNNWNNAEKPAGSQNEVKTVKPAKLEGD